MVQAKATAAAEQPCAAPIRASNLTSGMRTEGDFDRAIVDFDKAIQMNLNDADSHNNRGVASALGGPCTFAPSLPRLRPNSARSQPRRSIQTFNLQGGCHAYDADSHIRRCCTARRVRGIPWRW